MELIQHSSPVLLAHVFLEKGSTLYACLAVISVFVLGLLLCRKFVRTPRWLFVSSLISYVLLLLNVFVFCFGLWAPKIVRYLFFVVGIYPSLLIASSIGALADRLFGAERLFESGWWVIFDWNLCPVAFIINTLGIFAMIRLVVYVKHKVSAKKQETNRGP